MKETQKRVSCCAPINVVFIFFRNNRGMNDGKDLSEEFLLDLYGRIVGEEMKMLKVIKLALCMRVLGPVRVHVFAWVCVCVFVCLCGLLREFLLLLLVCARVACVCAYVYVVMNWALRLYITHWHVSCSFRTMCRWRQWSRRAGCRWSPLSGTCLLRIKNLNFNPCIPMHTLLIPNNRTQYHLFVCFVNV